MRLLHPSAKLSTGPAAGCDDCTRPKNLHDRAASLRRVLPGGSETGCPERPCRNRRDRRGPGAGPHPSPRGPVGALDPRGDKVRVARRDDAHGLQPVQAGALGQAGCSRLAWSPRGRPRCRPARRSWPGRRARTCTRWTAGHCNRPGRVRGSAPTRSPRRSPVTPRPPPARASFPSRSWLTFRPRPFISGHPRHVCARHGRSRTLANLSQQCWKACWRNPVLQAAAMARGLAADGSAGETGRADEC